MEEIHTEILEDEDASYQAKLAAEKLGLELGRSFGADKEKAWNSGVKINGTPLMDEHKRLKNEALDKLRNGEIPVFQAAYERGEIEGRDAAALRR